jgi:hypothetical protein
LAENIHDNRFLRLVGGMLQAGYLEDWIYHATLSGTPQGSLCSAEHKDPNEQRWIMRSVGSFSLAKGCGNGRALRITPRLTDASTGP